MIRALNIVALVLAIMLAIALYVAKNDAQHAQSRLQSLQAQIVSTRGQVRLLENEAAALENPERLARLAETHLGMVPVTEAARRTPKQAAQEMQQISAREAAEAARERKVQDKMQELRRHEETP